VDVPNAYPDPGLSADTENTEETGNDTDWDSYWDSPPENSKPALADAENKSPDSTLYPIWARGGSVGVIDGPDVDDGIPSDAGDAIAQGGPDVDNGPIPSDAENAIAQGGPVGVIEGPDVDDEPIPSDAGDAIAQGGPDVDDGPIPSGAGDAIAQDSPSVGAEIAPPSGGRTESISSGSVYIPAGEPVPSNGLGNVPLALIPAENRPPAPTDYVIPPEAFIAPIERSQSAQVAAASAPVQAPPGSTGESYFLDQIEKTMAPGGAAQKQAAGTAFSVPTIGELERGKYYLQLGVFSRSEAVEDALAKIDRSYPLAVQAAGSADRPAYRLLIGPVNQGESGALLQRFKRSGYGDAFVKSN
jgi:hypothetical protein